MPAAAIAAVGLVSGLAFSLEARSDTKKANRTAQRIEEVKTQRERARALQANRIAQADIFAAGANAGVGSQSSGIAGAAANTATQTNANIGFGAAVGGLTRDMQRQQMSAAVNTQNAGIANQVAGFASNFVDVSSKPAIQKMPATPAGRAVNGNGITITS